MARHSVVLSTWQQGLHIIEWMVCTSGCYPGSLKLCNLKPSLHSIRSDNPLPHLWRVPQNCSSTTVYPTDTWRSLHMYSKYITSRLVVNTRPYGNFFQTRRIHQWIAFARTAQKRYAESDSKGAYKMQIRMPAVQEKTHEGSRPRRNSHYLLSPHNDGNLHCNQVSPLTAFWTCNSS